MVGTDSFVEAVSRNIWLIPKRLWASILVILTIYYGVEVVIWPSEITYRAYFWISSTCIILGVSIFNYLAISSIIERHANTNGYMRYIISIIVMLLPAIIALSIAVVFKNDLEEGARLSIIVFGFGFSVFNNIFLAAWPIAQSLSSHIVSPLRVFRATRGHRWGLLAMTAVASAGNKVIPGLDSAENAGEALLLGVGGILVDSFIFALFASTSATAFIFASANDLVINSEPLDRPS